MVRKRLVVGSKNTVTKGVSKRLVRQINLIVKEEKSKGLKSNFLSVSHRVKVVLK